MDDAAREKFYAPGGDDWGDDGLDYELEPPDEEVIALQKRRAQEDMIASTLAIDVDEIYRDMDGRRDSELGEDAGQFQFRFQVKHLLMLTAAAAVILTLVQIKLFGSIAALVALALSAGALGYFELRQQQRWAEAQRRFAEKCERRRQFFESRTRTTTTGNSNKEEVSIYDDLSYGNSPGYAEWTTAAPQPPPSFRFQFSMREMFVATTIAAVLFTLINLLGGPQNAASVLGLIALVGLLIHATGADPPEIVVLGWWMVLLLYIILSIGAAISSAFS
jgi:hypothetical protein